MTGSACCCAVEGNFDHQLAARELAKYRRKGPSASTRRLLAAIRANRIGGAAVLDIGAGVGAVAMELLDSGAARATLVDASAAYIAAARDEGARRGLTARLEFVHGDFVAIAADRDHADVVTLDKVICCYPDLEPLLAASTARTRWLYGVVYPRDNWWVRLVVAAENGIRRLRGSAFRVYVFSNATIDRAIRRAGLSLVHSERDLSWVIALYERAAGRA